MDIAIFESITTEEAIKQFEAESEKYQGLYVEMDDKEQRKYVKDKAADIIALIKAVDRKRIDEKKRYGLLVEKQAKDITERLQNANLPFTLLIDEYKEERAKVLAEEKRVKELAALKIQIEEDHEIALLMNKTFEFDRAEELKIKKEHEEQIRKQAVIDAEIDAKLQAEKAVQAEKERVAQQEAFERYEKRQREANIEHKRTINNKALSDLIELGLTENNAQAVIKAIAKNLISNITINY